MGQHAKYIQKIGKSASGKRENKIAGSEVGYISEDPLSPPNMCTDTSVVQNSSSSVHISEVLDKDDNEIFKYLEWVSEHFRWSFSKFSRTQK